MLYSSSLCLITIVTAETSTLSIKLHIVPVFNISACVIKQIAQIHPLKISCYSSQLFLPKYIRFSSATNVFIIAFTVSYELASNFTYTNGLW